MPSLADLSRSSRTLNHSSLCGNASSKPHRSAVCSGPPSALRFAKILSKARPSHSSRFPTTFSLPPPTLSSISTPSNLHFTASRAAPASLLFSCTVNSATHRDYDTAPFSSASSSRAMSASRQTGRAQFPSSNCTETREREASVVNAQEPVPGLQLTATRHEPAFVKPFTPVEGPTVWYGKDLTVEDVSFNFTETDLTEIDSAVNAVRAKGLKIEDITRADFPLPTMGPKLDVIHKDLIFGRGIRLLRGAPLGVHLPPEHAITALWGISTYFGKQQVSDKAGHLVGHVRHDKAQLQKVSICSPIPMSFHADNSDIVLLACRAQAKTGGNSACVSSHAVHNEILATRPDLHKVLAEPFYSDRREWWPTGAPPYYISPCFHYHENTLGVQEVQGIEDSHKYLGAPAPTELQIEAVKYVQEVAGSEKLRFDFTLQPGDILLNHNLTTFHSRTTWVDGPTEAETRHAFRVWVASPYGWPLDPLYAERWVTTEVGARGGLNCPGTEHPHVTVDFDEFIQEHKDWGQKYGATADTASLKGGLTAQADDILKKYYSAEEYAAIRAAWENDKVHPPLAPSRLVEATA